MLRSLISAKIWWFRVVGRRGSALLFFAFLNFAYCWSLLTLPPPNAPSGPPLNPAFVFINDIAPLWVWAALWGGVGLICLVSAFLRPGQDTVAFSCAIGIKVLWSFIYTIGYFMDEIYRGWVAASVWFAMSLLVLLISTWPEPLGGDEWTPHMSSQESP